MPDPSRRYHVAIALVSFVVLFYQVAITRVLSVVLWYHFAFLSISLALLGVGAPGVWFALRGRRNGLAGWLLAGGVAVPLSLVVITRVVGRFPRAAGADAGTGFLNAGVLVTVVAVLVPFLCLGGAVCLLLLRAPGGRIGAMYGADLLGATLGAIVVVPLLNVAPTPTLIAAAGFLPFAAAALVSRSSAPWALAGSAALLAAILWGQPFALLYSKKYDEVAKPVLWEEWTPTARLTVFPDVFHGADPTAAFAWGFGERWPGRPVEQLWIEQDGSAGTPITRRTGNPEDLAHLFFDVTSVGYQIAEPERVCVVGAGGGRDILTARLAGASSIDAVELNGHIVRAVSNRFGEFSGDPYGLEGVTAVVSEGRSFLTRSQERYDLIQISMVDSWAATSAGAFALSENYLYTLEAFRLYWGRLSPRGILSVSRWMMDRHLMEAARLVLLAREALLHSGVGEPERHMAVVQAKAVATLLVSREPFDAAGLAVLDEICDRRGFVRHWPPHEGTPRGSFIARLLLEGPGPLEARGIDLSVPTDDRPFFFQTIPVVGRVDHALVERLSVNEQSVILLRRLLLVVGALTLALFFLPFATGRRFRGIPELWRGSAYFACIGLAFLLVEAAWVQRFILFLGHPSYATTVVLASLLLGAGLGSLASGRIGLSRVARWGFVLPVLLAAVNLVLAPVFRSALGWGIAERVSLSIVLLAPAGFLMGLWFPAGMIRFGDQGKPWYWAMNGAFSVLGSVSSLALAMLMGHAAVAYAGAAFYIGAFLILRPRGAWTGPRKSPGVG